MDLRYAIATEEEAAPALQCNTKWLARTNRLKIGIGTTTKTNKDDGSETLAWI